MGSLRLLPSGQIGRVAVVRAYGGLGISSRLLTLSGPKPGDIMNTNEVRNTAGEAIEPMDFSADREGAVGALSHSAIATIWGGRNSCSSESRPRTRREGPSGKSQVRHPAV